MAAKKGTHASIRRGLGKRTADAILKMAKEGVSPSTIEKKITEELSSQIEAAIAQSVNKDVKASVRKTLRPILRDFCYEIIIIRKK